MRYPVYLLALVLISLIYTQPAYSEGEKRFHTESLTFYQNPDLHDACVNPVNNLFYGFCQVAEDRKQLSTYPASYLCVSSDSGKTWTMKSKIVDEFDNSDWIYIDRNGYIYYIFPRGILISKDDGLSFKVLTDELDYTDCYISDIYVNTKNEVYVVLSCNNGFYSKKVFYTKDFGNTWKEIDPGFSMIYFYVDKNDQVYVISECQSVFESDTSYVYKWFGYYELICKRNKESINRIYKLDPENMSTQLIESSFLEKYPKNIFLSITSDDENLYILSGSYYYKKSIIQEWNNITIEKDIDFPEIRKIYMPGSAKQQTINQKVNFNYDSLNNFKVDYYDIDLSGTNNILVSWSSISLHIDTSLSNCRFAEHNSNGRIHLNSGSNTNIVFFWYGNRPIKGYSTDNGRTWRYYEKIELYPQTLLIQHLAGDTAITVDKKNNIYYKNKNIIGWRKIIPPIPDKIEITAITLSRKGNIIIGTKNNGIYYHTDEGTWIQSVKGLNNASIHKIIKGEENELYICSDKGFVVAKNELMNYETLLKKNIKDAIKAGNEFLMVSSDYKLYMADADGRYFNELSASWIKNRVTSIATNSRDVIIASTLSGGVFKITDIGRSWAPANNELLSTKVYQVISTKKDEFLALAETGIFFTNNDGEIWEKNPYPVSSNKSNYLNIKDDCRAELQEDGKVILYSHTDYLCIDSISSKPIVKSSGWINNGNYLESKNDRPVNLKKVSSDNRFAYMKYEVNFNRDYYLLLYKMDLHTGKYIYEKVLNTKNATLLDVNDDGSLALQCTSENTINGKTIYHIILYDILKDSVLFKIDPASNLPQNQIKVFAVFGDKLDRIYTAASSLDTSKNDQGLYSRGEVQERDLSGRILKTHKTGYILNLTYSHVARSIISFQNDLYGDAWNEYSIKQSYYTMYDLSRGRVLRFNLSITTNNLNNGSISPDSKYFVSYVDKSFYRCEIPHNETDSILGMKYFHSDKADNFMFFGPDSMLYYNYTTCYLYDFNEMKCIKQSIPRYDQTPKPFHPLISMNKILSTDSKGVACLYELDKILDFKEPSIHIDSTVTYKNNPVRFSASKVPGVKEVRWEFGDGYYEYGWEVFHEYKREGSYRPSITYNLINDESKRINSDQYVRVISPAIPEFNYFFKEGKGVVNVHVVSNTYGTVDKHVWDFGDGTIEEGTSMYHSYFKPGTYSIKLTVYNKIDSRSVIKENIIVVEKVKSAEVESSSSDFSLKDNTSIYKCMPGGNGRYYIALHQLTKNRGYHLYKENCIAGIDSRFGSNWDTKILKDSLNRFFADYVSSSNGDLLVLSPRLKISEDEMEAIEINRYNMEGNLLWQKLISEGAGVKPQAITATRDGGCISLFSIEDLYAVKQDQYGNIERKMLVKRDLQPEYARIIEASDGGYIICYEDDFDRRIMHINDTGKILLKGIVPDRGSCRDLCELSPSQYLVAGLVNNTNQFINRRAILYCYRKDNTGFKEVWRKQNDLSYEYLSAAKINDSYVVATGAYINNNLYYDILTHDGDKVESVNVMNKSGVFNHVLVNPDGSLILSGYAMINDKDYEPLIVKTKKLWAGADDPVQSSELKLKAFPNPVSNILNIAYTLPENNNISLSMVSQYGQVTNLIYDSFCSSGNFTIIHDVSSMAPGAYFLELTTGKEVAREKFVILK